MMLWVFLSAMLALATLGMALPFLRRDTAAIRSDNEVAFYRAQIQELETEQSLGMITENEANLAQREIERRMLVAAKTGGERELSTISDKNRLFGICLIAGWIVLGSVLLYGAVGRPDLPASNDAGFVAETMQLPPAASPTPAATAQQPMSDVDTMIARLAERLVINPNDVEGWRMLGWSYARTGKLGEAVSAYSRAVALKPRDAAIMAQYGEAVVMANSGQVDAVAREIFDTALGLDPTELRARIYQGVMMDQEGRTEDAITHWLGLLEAVGPESATRPDLLARIRNRAAAINYDLSDLPAMTGAAPPRAVVASPTVSSQAVQDRAVAMQGMEEGEMNAVIRDMVDGLAQRLEDNPDEPDGWARLIQSYSVLGERDAAIAALAKARETFANRPSELSVLNALAAQMKLP